MRPITKKVIIILISVTIYISSLRLTQTILDENSVIFGTWNLFLAGVFATATHYFFMRSQSAGHISTSKAPKRSFYSLIIAIFLIMLLTGFVANVKLVLTQHLFIKTALAALSIGIFEECLCRGMLFSTLHEIFQSRKHVLIIISILNSLIFGVFHLVNLFTTTQGSNATFQQVVMAFSIGVAFSAIRIYSGSLILPVVIHTVFDFQPDITTGNSGNNSWIAILIVFGILLLISITLIVKLQKRENGHR